MHVNPKKMKCLPIPLGRRDLTGQRFNRLVAVGFLYVKHRKSHFLCKCDCGNHIVGEYSSLKGGNTSSCGCLRIERTIAAVTTHGMTRNGGRAPEYESWAGIRKRVDNPKNAKYADYGGRGITMCDRWRKFENFMADMGPKPSKRHSLDRIDVDGNYEPNNCRWALPITQARNQRRSLDVLRSDGVRFETMKDAAEASGMTIGTMELRLKGRTGWRPDKYTFTRVPRLHPVAA